MKTAIDWLRLRHKKSGLGTWPRTMSEAKAILELADRVDKLEIAAEARSALLRYNLSDESPPIKPLRESSATESQPVSGSIDWTQPLECDEFGKVVSVSGLNCASPNDERKGYRQVRFETDNEGWQYWDDGTCCAFEKDARKTLRAIGSEKTSTQPFTVTGPGRYRMRNGEEAVVEGGYECGSWFWDGTRGPLHNETRSWRRNGTADAPQFDIIEGPLSDAPAVEMAVWKRADGKHDGTWYDGIIHFSPDRKWFFVIPHPPKPEPKNETGWVNVHQNRAFAPSGLQLGPLYPTKQEADQSPGATDRVACVEVTFKRGGG